MITALMPCALAEEEKSAEDAFEEYVETLKNQPPIHIPYTDHDVLFNDAYLIDVDNDGQAELVAAYTFKTFENFEYKFARIFEYDNGKIAENDISDSLDIFPIKDGESVYGVSGISGGFFMANHPEENYFTERSFCTDGTSVYLRGRDAAVNIWSANCYENGYWYTLCEICPSKAAILEKYINVFTSTQSLFGHDDAAKENALSSIITDRYFKGDLQKPVWRWNEYDSEECDKSVYDEGAAYINSFTEMPVFNGLCGDDLYRYYNTVKVYVNGERINFPNGKPFQNKTNGDTMVPIRAIAEAMGDTVLWNDDIQTAYVNHGDRVMLAEMDSTELMTAFDSCFENWTRREMTSAVVVANGSTCVPLRAFCESLGAQVDWTEAEKRVDITYSPDTLGEPLSENDIENINVAYLINNALPDFTAYTSEINDFTDSRDQWKDALGKAYSDIEQGAKSLLGSYLSLDDAREEENKRLIKKTITQAIAKIDGCADSEITVSDKSAVTETIDGICKILSDFYGENCMIKTLSDTKETADKVVDWTGFTADRLVYIIQDYNKNVDYLRVFRDAVSSEVVEEVISELIADYTYEWTKTVEEYSKKFTEIYLDDEINQTKDALPVLKNAAALYDVFTFAIDTTNNITGLDDKVDGAYNLYAMRQYNSDLDRQYALAASQVMTASRIAAVTRDNTDLEKAYDNFKRLFKIQQATATVGYESIKAASDNKDYDAYADGRIKELSEMDFMLWK